MENGQHHGNPRADSWLIRDDAAGTLRSSLEAAISEARSLRERSETLERETGFVRWREELLGWRLRSAEMLRRVFEREAANEFLRGARLWDFPLGKWAPQLRDDRRALDDTIELLVSLRNTLAAGGERRPRMSRESPAYPSDGGGQT